MKNPFMNLNRIEFTVTLLCSGKCKHCSVAPKLNRKGYKCVDIVKASKAIKSLADIFDIESLMTFGGEPLLYPDITCAIHKTAYKSGIAERQLITNGYFSKNPDVIKKTASSIRDSGINDIMISVDAFHQETIPLKTVRLFAEALLEQNIKCIKFHPAWVVDSSHLNRYNDKTNKILNSLTDLGIEVSSGNNIFPAGNAEIYLTEFYPKPEKLDLTGICGETPYTDRLDDVHCLSIEPNGNVVVCAFTIGNIYEEDIDTIIERYNPYDNKMMKALMESGVKGLVEYAERRGITIDASTCYSACSVCKKIIAAFDR